MLIQPLIKAFLGNTVLATDHHPAEFEFEILFSVSNPGAEMHVIR